MPPPPGPAATGAARPPPPTAGDELRLTLVLRRRSAPAEFRADLAGATRPGPRRFLDRDEFRTRHGLHPDDRAAVERFARGHGLSSTVVSEGGRTMALVGPEPRVLAAFRCERSSLAVHGATRRFPRTGPIVPPELSDRVIAVLGLDERPIARPHVRRHRTPAPTDVAYSPLEVGGAYGFPTGANGDGQTIGILELGGGFAAADLAAFFGGLGLPAPTVTVVPVDGAQNAPTGSVDGPDAEVDLDLEIAGALAPGGRLVAYFAPNTDQGFVDGLSAAVHDATNAPGIVSISWGGPESGWPAASRAALEAACEDAATLGLSVLVAAGDQGATDGVAGGALTVDFPASSPYVTGCGGTRLLLSPTRTEVVWNETAIGEGATGGGVSEVFPKPTYQGSISVPAAPNGFAGRGVPDVAGNADPASGYQVRVDGEAVVLGGTSAVAPLWAALVARLNQALGARVGYLDPTIYAAPADASFTDITSGNNDGYSAAPGWDPCTGLGSPNGTQLLSALARAQKAD
jgi:kumamolisin